MILNKDYKILSKYYQRDKTNKKQIVLGNLYFDKIENFKKSLEKGGGLTKCPHFSIDKEGIVYQHFNIDYYSRYLDSDCEEHVISIALLNLGHLFKKGDIFFDIYNKGYHGEVFEKRWKNCKYWQPYTEEQYNSSIELCRYLLEESGIASEVIPMNVHKQDIFSFTGVTYRSNYDIKHYDLNPSWDFNGFKTTIENG